MVHTAGNKKDKEEKLLCVIKSQNTSDKLTSINISWKDYSTDLYDTGYDAYLCPKSRAWCKESVRLKNEWDKDMYRIFLKALKLNYNRIITE